MTRDEYNAIYDLLRQKIIVVPQDCLLLRFRDVSEILDYFVEPRKLENEDN